MDTITLVKSEPENDNWNQKILENKVFRKSAQRLQATDPAMMAEFKDANGDIGVNIGGRQQFHTERSMLLGVAVLLWPVQSARLKHTSAAVLPPSPQRKTHLK